VSEFNDNVAPPVDVISGTVTIDLDVFTALQEDRKRLEWIMPIVTGGDNPDTNKRTVMLARALINGKDMREALDFAMALCNRGS